MSNVVVFNPKVPAHLRGKELSETAKALMGGGGGGKRLSIRGGVFRLIINGKEVGKIDDRHLDVVIVAAAPKVQRTYYEGAYDPESVTAPLCWSSDGVTPDAAVTEPKSKACATCPNNIKGSGKGESKACRFSQRIAVVLANDMEGDVLQLSVPATSVFGQDSDDKRPLQAYARWLGAQNAGPEQLVTRLRFDTNAEMPKLFFEPVRWLTAEEYDITQAQGKTPDAVMAITLTVSQTDGVKQHAPAKDEGTEEDAGDDAEAEAPVVKKATPKLKPKAKAAEEEAEEDSPEPTVRKPAKAVAPGSKDWASMVDEWDD